MVVFDTNIFIYVGAGKLKRSAVEKVDACYASITRIEALGYHKITAAEERLLSAILDAYVEIELSEPVIERAIALRQAKNLSLADAIVAATAIEQNCELWTANSADFRDIPELRLHNPLKTRKAS